MSDEHFCKDQEFQGQVGVPFGEQ